MVPCTTNQQVEFGENKDKVVLNVGTLVPPTKNAFIHLDELPSDRRTCEFCEEAFSNAGVLLNYPVRLPVSNTLRLDSPLSPPSLRALNLSQWQYPLKYSQDPITYPEEAMLTPKPLVLLYILLWLLPRLARRVPRLSRGPRCIQASQRYLRCALE